jgi:hypothetical protein
VRVSTRVAVTTVSLRKTMVSVWAWQGKAASKASDNTAKGARKEQFFI